MVSSVWFHWTSQLLTIVLSICWKSFKAFQKTLGSPILPLTTLCYWRDYWITLFFKFLICKTSVSFAYPWRLMMLNIFSYVCWPFVCLFLRNVYSDLSPFLKIGILDFCYYNWVVWVPCIFWLKGCLEATIIIWITFWDFVRWIDCRYFLPFYMLSLHSVDCFLGCPELFSLIWFCLFGFAYVVCIFEILSKKILCSNLCSDAFSQCFFLVVS